MRWDVVSGLFRVYEKGGDAPTSTTSVQQNFSPEEAAARAKVQQEAQRVYDANKGTLASSPYPGAAPVDFSQNTQQAQKMLTGYAQGAGQDLANKAASYSNFMMGPAQYAESNPYLQSAIGAAVRPVTQSYTDPGGVMSTIRTGAMGAGGQGTSTRQGIAEGIAAGRYADTVGDISSTMSNANYQNAQKAGMQAAALAPQTYNLGTAPATSTAAVGTQQEMLKQAQEDYAAQQRMWGLNAPWTPLQNYANIVFGGAAPGTTTTATGSVAQQGRWAQALSGSGTGAAVGSQVGGPFGGAVGGGIGLLAGLFS